VSGGGDAGAPVTIAELGLLCGAVAGIYFLLRPLQRRLEALLLKTFASPHQRLRRRIIDVTPFTARSVQKKDEDD
jgi:hypothetical protein